MASSSSDLPAHAAPRRDRDAVGRGMQADGEIVVQAAVRSGNVPSATRIRHWVGEALGEASRGEVTVRVVGETESARLNERYRRGSGATNVLAFAYGESPCADAERSFGDLVICAAVVEREAARQGKSLDAHWAHIAIHGALHLLGYDHEDPEEARIMEGRERELLEALGFADPHAVEC